MAEPSIHGSIEGAGTGSRKVFWLFCLGGLLLVASGALGLRLERTIKATGQVRAATEFYVFSPADGLLESMRARIGREVEEGDVLFTLAAPDLELRILEKERLLREKKGEIATLESALRLLDLRPAEADMLTAAERLALIREIRAIQKSMLDAWDKLEGERAIRALDYNLQRVAALRTEAEALESEVLLGWLREGFPELRREELQQSLHHARETLAVVNEEKGALERLLGQRSVTAPIRGTVADIYTRYPGMAVRGGQSVLKIVDTGGGYRVKAYVPERNIDLLSEGLPVRMESHVFDSLFEGRVRGRISRVVRDAGRNIDGPPDTPLYEVTVTVESTPHPLVLGSMLDVEFLLGRQSLLAMLLNRPEPREVDEDW